MKNKIISLFFTFVFALGIFSLAESAQAKQCQWSHGHLYCWHKHHHNYHGYYNCRWVPAHWYRGVYYPAHKVCWYR